MYIYEIDILVPWPGCDFEYDMQCDVRSPCSYCIVSRVKPWCCILHHSISHTYPTGERTGKNLQYTMNIFEKELSVSYQILYKMNIFFLFLNAL